MTLVDRDYMKTEVPQRVERPLQGTWDDRFGKAEPPPPTEYRPRRRFLGLVASVALFLIAAGAGMFGYLQNHSSSAPPSVVPQTSQAAFEKQIDQYAKSQGATEIATTNCAWPKTWTVGESFPCYLYGPSGATNLGTVLVQVTQTQPTDTWNANFTWTAV